METFKKNKFGYGYANICAIWLIYELQMVYHVILVCVYENVFISVHLFLVHPTRWYYDGILSDAVFLHLP